jgi:hypothetical protein
MNVRTTIDIPDDLHAAPRQQAAAQHTSIRSLIIDAIESKFRPRPSRRDHWWGKKVNRQPATGNPDRENPTTYYLPDLNVWLACWMSFKQRYRLPGFPACGC